MSSYSKNAVWWHWWFQVPTQYLIRTNGGRRMVGQEEWQRFLWLQLNVVTSYSIPRRVNNHQQNEGEWRANLPLAITTPSTPSSSSTQSASYRLLYRGALSLPDSHLTLDGITFCAHIETPSKNRHAPKTPNGSSHYNDSSLLKNPLALALESMRGRPTLRLIGTVRLSDVCMDESGGFLMWVS